MGCGSAPAYGSAMAGSVGAKVATGKGGHAGEGRGHSKIKGTFFAGFGFGLLGSSGGSVVWRGGLPSSPSRAAGRWCPFMIFDYAIPARPLVHAPCRNHYMPQAWPTAYGGPVAAGPGQIPKSGGTTSRGSGPVSSGLARTRGRPRRGRGLGRDPSVATCAGVRRGPPPSPRAGSRRPWCPFFGGYLSA